MGIQKEEYPCPKCRDTSKRLEVTEAELAAVEHRLTDDGREAMSMRLKQYDEKRLEVDVGVRLSSGQRYRERRLLTLSKS